MAADEISKSHTANISVVSYQRNRDGSFLPEVNMQQTHSSGFGKADNQEEIQRVKTQQQYRLNSYNPMVDSRAVSTNRTTNIEYTEDLVSNQTTLQDNSVNQYLFQPSTHSYVRPSYIDHLKRSPLLSTQLKTNGLPRSIAKKMNDRDQAKVNAFRNNAKVATLAPINNFVNSNFKQQEQSSAIKNKRSYNTGTKPLTVSDITSVGQVRQASVDTSDVTQDFYQNQPSVIQDPQINPTTDEIEQSPTVEKPLTEM